jgi:hypothetical protein
MLSARKSLTPAMAAVSTAGKAGLRFLGFYDLGGRGRLADWCGDAAGLGAA